MTKATARKCGGFFFAIKMKVTFRIFMILMGGVMGVLHAQSPGEAEEAHIQVFNALTASPSLPEGAVKNLSRGAWEALSYLEEADTLKIENLKEAVADYYHFKSGLLYLKLIDPKSQEDYGLQMTVPYLLNKAGEVELMDAKTGKVKDRWKILYLDATYLALDVGDLRVFFIHTPAQE